MQEKTTLNLDFIKKIPVYKELYSSLLDQPLSVADLEKFPELSKVLISREFPNNWMTKSLKQAIEKNEYEFMTTSGTTSERTQLIRPKNWWYGEEKRLFKYLNKSFPQYANVQNKAILTTAICSNTLCYKETPNYEKRIVNGILQLNISPDPNRWSKNDIERIVQEIDHFKPMALQADPVYLALFFKLLIKYKLSLPKWTPKLLILTYEFQPRKCLKTIRSFWNIPSTIIYGTTEVGFMFYECPNKKYHWISDSSFIRFKPIEGKKDVFELLITSLRNPYMPFINYNTFDHVKRSFKQCSCGLSDGIVDQFMGRSKDLTYSDTGPVTLGEIDDILFKLENNILQYALDFRLEKKMLFKYTTFDDQPLSSKQADEIKLALNMLYKLEIEIVHEQEILPAASGKFEIIQK